MSRNLKYFVTDEKREGLGRKKTKSQINDWKERRKEKRRKRKKCRDRERDKLSNR